MKVAIIIPFRDRGRDPYRAQNLEYVAWLLQRSNYPIHVVDDGRAGDEQFNRSLAYNRAVEQIDADVYVFHESDLMVPPRQLVAGIQAAAESPGLVVPFSKFIALEEDDSCLVRLGELTADTARGKQQRGDCKSIGAVNIVSRQALYLVGRYDPEFSGHAFDDDAMERAFSICAGPTRFIEGPAWHLYHVPGAFYNTPESTAADLEATARNKARYQLYKNATTPEQIRALTSGTV